MALEKSVWDVMDVNFDTVTPETPLREACAILTDRSKGKPGALGLVVVRSSEEYIGVLTVKDILRYVIFLYKRSRSEGKAEDWLAEIREECEDGSLITVNDVLVRYDISVNPNQKLLEVIQVMENLAVEIIPVSDAGKIIGVVRQIDILAEIARMVR